MSTYNELRDDLFCTYCNKQCKNLNSLYNHQRLCSNNPDHDEWSPNLLAHNRGKHPWNYGLAMTEEVKSKLRLGAKRYIEQHPDQIGKAKNATLESQRRLKISKSIKQSSNCGGLRIGSGRGKKGWYKGFYCRSTYELVYVIYNLDHNISFSACKRVYTYIWNGEVHKYYPDFELDDGTVIEIKGYSNAQTQAKIASVKDRAIKVLYQDDLKYAFDYVDSTYTYTKLEDLYQQSS